MTKEFIPYQQAIALKKLGFDEPCFGKFDYTELEVGGKWSNSLFKNVTEDIFTAAPTYSQAFRWLREQYNLVIQYIPYELDDGEGQSILYHKYKISEYDSWRGGRRNTVETELDEDYELAELECLKKLIQICLEQQKATKTGSLNAQAYIGEKL